MSLKPFHLSIDLKNIESLYNEELVIAGELLFESNKVSDLMKSESGIFFAKVKDGKDYEIEIKYPFVKKQKVRCDCTFFVQSGICKHVLATLFSIRNQSKIKTLAPKNSSSKPKPTKLVVAQILEEVPHLDLKHFVQAYARNDKKFETQLKVAFAIKIDIVNNQEKYKSILNSIVRPLTGAQAHASVADLRLLAHVLVEFADQIEDSLALFQYREALDIYIASFSKLEYVRSKYKNQSDPLYTLSQRYHKILSHFLQQKLPFEIKNDLLSFVKELYQRSYYLFDSYSDNVVHELLNQINKDEKIEVSDFLVATLPQKKPNELAVILALIIKIKNTINSNIKELINKYQNSYMDIVDLLMSKNEDTLAIKLLESLQTSKSKDVHYKLTLLYAKTNDNISLSATVEEAFIKYGDLKYLEILEKQFTDTEYQNFISKLESKLLSLNHVHESSLLNLYFKEQNWAGMIIFMEKNPNIEILKKYDVFINTFEPKMLSELYIISLRVYLNHQLGDQATLYLNELKYHLNKTKLDKVINKISKLLLEEYPHRPKLSEVFS